MLVVKVIIRGRSEIVCCGVVLASRTFVSYGEGGSTYQVVWVIVIGVAALPIPLSLTRYHSVAEGSFRSCSRDRRCRIGCRCYCRRQQWWSWRWW